MREVTKENQSKNSERRAISRRESKLTNYKKTGLRGGLATKKKRETARKRNRKEKRSDRTLHQVSRRWRTTQSDEEPSAWRIN